MFPPEYRGQVFIAEHGSWNRSKKIGYRVSLVRLDGDDAISYEPFAYGWLQGEQYTGRPVDLIVKQDGSLLVSDDHAGKIYSFSLAYCLAKRPRYCLKKRRSLFSPLAHSLSNSMAIPTTGPWPS
jgi:hypothetical protein